MKEFWEKIKEKYADVRTELLWMALFVALFLILNGSKLAQGARETFGRGTVKETEAAAENETETETETESETETETETETEALSPAEKARRLREVSSRLGVSFTVPMTMPREEDGELHPIGLEEMTSLPRYNLLRLQEEAEEEEGASLETLQAMVENTIAEYDGDWSVYVKNLTTDESFVVNDRPMKSASVMKLFIMGTVYKAFESGELERTDEIMSLVNSMITVSDNESSNQLLYLLGDSSYEQGIAKVDEFIQEYGFSDMTVEYNGFNDPATNVGDGNYNQVAAKDCGRLLEDIYRRTWMSRRVSNEMEELLLNQQTRYKIPAGLPEGVLCGNKTGEMDTTENDAAIIYGPQCDYILVALSSDWNSKDEAIGRIQYLSELVYEYLNGE